MGVCGDKPTIVAFCNKNKNDSKVLNECLLLQIYSSPPPLPIQFKIFEILLKHCKNTFLYITSFTLQSDDLSSRNIYSSSILGSTMYPPLPPCVTSLPVMRLQVFSEDSSNSSSVQAHINFSFLRKVFKTVCQFVHPSILLLYWLYCRLALYLAAVAL